MFTYFLKTAYRYLIRNKSFSLLNISGLAIGFASSMLILLWVNDELSFDQFHEHAPNIYRLTGSAGDFKAAVSPAGMAEQLKAKIPHITNVSRISKPFTTLYEVNGHKFEENQTFYADPQFLQIFSFRLLQGDAKTALSTPNAILLTENLAKKYFGKEDPMGKIIRRDNQDDLLVTGVLENPPSNSHLHFTSLMSMDILATFNDDLKKNTWENFNFYTYLLTDKNWNNEENKITFLNRQITELFTSNVSTIKVAFNLQPLNDIHLHSDLQMDLSGHGNNQYVHTFFIISIFILVIASINFMNLSTARSTQRAKEVGLRKMSGALRHQLLLQFMGETLFISFLAFLVSLFLVWLLFPAFQEFSGKQMAFDLFNMQLMIKFWLIALATGLLSGIYPAIYLSHFPTVKVLKGKYFAFGGNLALRNGLVVTQFIVAIIMLIGTAVFHHQLKFIRTMNLGFDRENLLYVNLTGDLNNKIAALKTELSASPLINNYTIISELPTSLISGAVNVVWEGKDPRSQIVFPHMSVDEYFLDVFKMKLLAGRSFSKDFPGDASNFVVNEKTLEIMGMKLPDAVGKHFSFNNETGTIIGVVKDFNFKPIQDPIGPLILKSNQFGGKMVIRTNTLNLEAVITQLQKINQKLNPNYPLSYNFVDQDIANLYTSEQQTERLFNAFALLSILISCLGLYGLSAFIANQRTREIGIRKVLGASAFNIAYLLSRKFTGLVFIAMCIAIPSGWIFAKTWLNNFAYRIEMGWDIVVPACLSCLLIAWLTISYETAKSALANPTSTLRSD